MKRALKAGFMSLPKPENNFELLVPDDEEQVNGSALSEDAAKKDPRATGRQEEGQRRTLARRSQVVQLGFPRPANITLGGYQVRSNALAKRITDAFSEFERIKVGLECFPRVRTNESATGPRSVSALKEEVEKFTWRERMLQERCSELDAERKESEARVAALEEKVMGEAETSNEAALAEMESE